MASPFQSGHAPARARAEIAVYVPDVNLLPHAIRRLWPGYRIAVFLPNWVGDAVMATPALRAIHGHFGPASHIVGIARPTVIGALDGTRLLDEIWPFDHRSQDPSLRAKAIAERMRRRRFHLAILLIDNLRTAELASAGRARKRIGYARNGRDHLLTDPLGPPAGKGGWPRAVAVDYYLNIARALGCPPESPRMEIATRPEDDAAADRAFAELGLPGDGSVIAMNSSGAYGAAKLWPDEHFAELARRVAVELGRHSLFICGPDERGRARDISRAASHPRVVHLADRDVSLGLTKACLRRCAALVTTDSGPRHIAAALGLPVIALFGPTAPEWTDTHCPRESWLRIQVECGPCQEKTCPLGHHRCMRDLGVDGVMRALSRAVSNEAVTR